MLVKNDVFLNNYEPLALFREKPYKPIVLTQWKLIMYFDLVNFLVCSNGVANFILDDKIDPICQPCFSIILFSR